MEEIKDRSAKAFYEAIDEADQDKTTLLITVIDGEYAGEKVLFSGSELVWASNTDGFAMAHKKELLAISESGCSDLRGRPCLHGCYCYRQIAGHACDGHR